MTMLACFLLITKSRSTLSVAQHWRAYSLATHSSPLGDFLGACLGILFFFINRLKTAAFVVALWSFHILGRLGGRTEIHTHIGRRMCGAKRSEYSYIRV